MKGLVAVRSPKHGAVPRQQTLLHLLIALGIVLSGCRDKLIEPAAGLPSVEELAQELGPGIHPVVALPTASAWRSGQAPIRIHLLAVDMDVRVQSYQGWIRFDPELMEVLDGSSPEGILGAWNEVKPGDVRFAGVSLEGVGDDHVLELGVKARRPLVAGDLTLSLDEVTGTQATAAFKNLMSDVRLKEVAPVMALRPSVRP
jgi:hypothetical protein